MKKYKITADNWSSFYCYAESVGHALHQFCLLHFNCINDYQKITIEIICNNVDQAN